MHDNKNLIRIRFENLLTTILERVISIEQRLDDVAVDVDAIDRFNRPYGDGTRIPPRRRRR